MPSIRVPMLAAMLIICCFSSVLVSGWPQILLSRHSNAQRGLAELGMIQYAGVPVQHFAFQSYFHYGPEKCKPWMDTDPCLDNSRRERGRSFHPKPEEFGLTDDIERRIKNMDEVLRSEKPRSK
uniref:Uncharacterized protein n=1 Tax=Mesocestoides corti TaxID=53468 RepID=A0A5K3FKB1_MESCO